MRKFIKVMAYVLAVPVATVTAAFTYGIYTSIQDASRVDANIASYEIAMDSFEGCGDSDKAAYDANPSCSMVCESYFQCRNDYLILEELVSNEISTLYGEVYTYEEYENLHGPLDTAEFSTDPGTPPKPIVN